jgi:hypothetical protein
VSDGQQALRASFDSLPENDGRRQALEAEAQARGDALHMRRAYMCSDLAAVT